MAKSEFSILFTRHFDIYNAIEKAVSASRSDGGAIDPTAVVKEITATHPDMTLAPAVLLEEVVRAASEAGLSLKVNPQT
jgi:hypothetical protein